MNPTLPPFVQELLDRRVDPVNDPRTQEWLLEHPEALTSFAELRGSLRALTRPAPPRSRPWRPVAWLTAAIAAGLALAGLVGNARNDSQPPPIPSPDFATSGGVVYSRVAITHRDGALGRQRVEIRRRSRGSAGPAVDLRDLTTLSTYTTLSGSEKHWSIVRVTEHQALIP